MRPGASEISRLLPCPITAYGTPNALQASTLSINSPTQAEGNAAIFIGYVNEAIAAEALATKLVSLRSAQAIFAKLVDGATGVAEAKVLFAAEKEAYLAAASAMNASVEEQSYNLVQIAFANLKVGVSDKVAFIIKKIYEL